MNKSRRQHRFIDVEKCRSLLLILGLILLFIGSGQNLTFAAIEREPVKIRVVAVNPSKEKPRTFKVKAYLPQEVTSNDIINAGGLTVGYDSERSMYYLYKDGIELAPKGVRVFEAQVRDVWVISEQEFAGLKKQSESALSRLKGTEFYEAFQPVAEDIYKLLDKMAGLQNDETVSRTERIGNYRTNIRNLARIKEDIERMEKLTAAAAGGLAQPSAPPSILDKAKVKTPQAPSKSITWMIVFIIMIFVGLLAAVFFFTWHRHSRSFERVIASAREESFPKSKDESSVVKPTKPEEKK